MLEDLQTMQHGLEQFMVDEAVSRQLKENESSTERNEWADSRAGIQYVKSVMSMKDTEENQSLVSLVADLIDVTTKRGPGRYTGAAHLLAKTMLPAEVIAFLTVKAALNGTSIYSRRGSSIKRTTLSVMIADAVQDEWRTREFADTDKRKALLKKLFKDFDKRAYPKSWRKRTIKQYFDAEITTWQGWTTDEKVKVGYALLVLYAKATGFVQFTPDGGSVEVTEGFVEHVQKMSAKQASLFILYRPMVVKPIPWDAKTNLMRGGYITDQVKRYPIVKGSLKRDMPRLIAMDWSKIIPAINALQETPWRVSKEMLEAVKWAYYVHTPRMGEAGDWRGIGKLPCCEQEAFPPIPEDYDTNPEVKKLHNRVVFDIRDRRRVAKGRRINAAVTLSIAEQFKDFDAVYFPHNLDSRGRAYPVPAFLNPQGPDYVKALLEFSHGEPVDTPEALEWIAIAGANAYGKDKISLKERVAWVHDNEDMILSIAGDYKHDLRWLSAGEPFQFLRFCFEWRDIQANDKEHRSHFVVPVDATCSGLQHYSAMLRDEVGGRSVNLVPGLQRQDIYGDVASVVRDGLAKDGSLMAQHWLAFGIDRKITKRQVMVVPYAGKFSSCMSYTREAVEEKMADGAKAPWPTPEDEQDYIVYLAKLIWDAIDAVVVKGKEAMSWLSKVASEYSKAMNGTDSPVYARRMTWVTPDGFEVVHFREDDKIKRIETYFEGRTRLAIYEGTGRLSPKDMALAVAPNFVHSLDATLLRMSVIKGMSIGIHHFAMIHDSFGTHANKMTRFLTECVRPSFVQMYEEHDVLQEFAHRFEPVCDVPPVPDRGTLNLQGVLHSEFFFS